MGKIARIVGINCSACKIKVRIATERWIIIRKIRINIITRNSKTNQRRIVKHFSKANEIRGRESKDIYIIIGNSERTLKNSRGIIKHAIIGKEIIRRITKHWKVAIEDGRDIATIRWRINKVESWVREYLITKEINGWTRIGEIVDG